MTPWAATRYIAQGKRGSMGWFGSFAIEYGIDFIDNLPFQFAKKQLLIENCKVYTRISARWRHEPRPPSRSR
jgi:hypothetical protein